MIRNGLGRALAYSLIVSTLAFSAGCSLQALRPDQPPTAPAGAASVQESDQPSRDQAQDTDETSGQTAGPAETLATDDGRYPHDLWSRVRRGFALPHHDRPRIEAEMAWFQDHQDYLERVTERARPYLRFIVTEVERRNMPTELALLPVVESGYQPFAYSSGRAAGLWQFIPGTGRRFGLKQNWWYDGRRDVVAATRGALDYLQELHDDFGGNWLHAIAAYNCGEGNVAKAIEENRRAGKPTDFWHLNLPDETRGYVPRLLAIARLVQDPEAHGVTLASIPDKPYLDQVDVGGQIDLALAAKLAGISLDELYRLNPGFNRWATDPKGPHYLMLPVDKVASFQERLEQLPSEKRMRWDHHQVRRGDTLIIIAKHHHTTVSELRQANHLRGNLIRVGQELTVPVATDGPRDDSLIANARQRAAHLQRAGESSTIYVVRRGDSLWSISHKRNLTVATLAKWNRLSPRDALHPGQKLTIRSRSRASGTAVTSVTPAVTGRTTRRIRYTVRAGESLWLISQRFNVSIASLRTWNSLNRGRCLQPGQTLVVFVDVTRQSENI